MNRMAALKVGRLLIWRGEIRSGTWRCGVQKRSMAKSSLKAKTH